MAPAVVFLGVYAYEHGRYHFLKVPPEFIDLSLNRLLAGGAVIGALALTLVGLTWWVWKSSASKGRQARFLAAFLAMVVFLALPAGLWLQTLPSFHIADEFGDTFQAFASILAFIVAGFTATSGIYSVRRQVERAMQSARNADDDGVELEVLLVEPAPAHTRRQKTGTWKALGAVALLFWTASVFAGLGYRVERSTTSRICTGDHFVADVHGDHLLLKSFDPKSGEILSPIKVVEIQGSELDSCSPKLVGAKGLAPWG